MEFDEVDVWVELSVDKNADIMPMIGVMCTRRLLVDRQLRMLQCLV